MYASKKIINFGGIELEVYQLPNGEYKLSNSQVALALEKNPRSFFDWSNKQIATTLTDSDLSELALPSVTEINIGAGRPIKGVGFKIALAYWTHHANKGDTKAQALLAAGTEETLTRLADNAFGVVKTEQQYQLETHQNMEVYQQLLPMMQTLLTEMQEIKQELLILRPAYEKLEKIESTLEDYPNLKEALEYLVANAHKVKKTYPLAQWLKDNNLDFIPTNVRMSIGRLVSSWCKLIEFKAPKGQYSDAFDPVLRFAVNYKLTQETK